MSILLKNKFLFFYCSIKNTLITKKNISSFFPISVCVQWPDGKISLYNTNKKILFLFFIYLFLDSLYFVFNFLLLYISDYYTIHTYWKLLSKNLFAHSIENEMLTINSTLKKPILIVTRYIVFDLAIYTAVWCVFY